MNFDAQRQVASRLPGATEDIKWGEDASDWVVVPLDDERFLELTGVPGVIPAPYLARAKWVQVKAGHALGTPALNALIERSHALVMARLTKKLQRELNA